MANTMNPQALFEQLELVLANPKSYFHDAEARAKFQLLARKARTATEEPFETLQRIVYYVSLLPVPPVFTHTQNTH